MAASTPKPVYVICGSESFLKRQALRSVLRGLGIHPADDSMAVTQFDAEAELSAVLDELRTLPLLAEHRVVMVDEADAFIAAHRPQLERYLAAPSDRAHEGSATNPIRPVCSSR